MPEIIDHPEQTLMIKDEQIGEKNLPFLISQQVDKIKQLDRHVNEAEKAAKSARESAEEAKYKSAGFGKKKAAIEHLQTATYDLATAVQLGTDAQRVSFEFQTKLAEITKYLFSLGVSNIASNRFVVRELELRLKGASEEELSELARQEIKAVVRQLKEQENLLIKLENISKNMKEQDALLQKQSLLYQEMDRQMNELVNSVQQNEKKWNSQILENKKVEKQLKAHNLKNKDLENKHKNLAKSIRLQSEKLKEHARIYKLHDETIKAHEGIFKQQSEMLQKHEEMTAKHREMLDQLAAVYEKLEHRLTAQSQNSKEQIDVLNGQIDKQNERLADLHHGLNGEIKSNQEKIEMQGKELKTFAEEMHLVKKQLEGKASAKMSKANLGIVLIALILSIVNFFI